jgi:hypothetical protein
MLQEMDDEYNDDLLADVLAQAIEATELTVAQPKLTFIQQVKEALMVDNSWEVYEKIKHQISDPAYGEVLVLILMDALNIVGEVYQAHVEFENMAADIIKAASMHISAYWGFEGDKLPEEIRPATIYRRWIKPCRFLAEMFKEAKLLVKDIILEQTLPLSELDAPDWVDQYTMETDPTAERGFVKIAARGEFSASKSQQAEDLGWDETTVQAFADAQEGFSEGNAIEEEFTGEWGQDYKEPMFMQMQHDFASSTNLVELRNDIQPLVEHCRDRIEHIVKKEFEGDAWEMVQFAQEVFPKAEREILHKACQMVLEYPKDQDEKLRSMSYTIFKECEDFVTSRRNFASSPEAEDFLKKLQRYIDQGESPVDVALIFLGLQHGYGFDIEDGNRVITKVEAPFVAEENKSFIIEKDMPVEVINRKVRLQKQTLMSYILSNEEDIMANLESDKIGRSEEMPEVQLDEFCNETMQMLVAQGEAGSKDVTKTPEYIRGYMEAAFGAKDGDTANCIAAGWDGWRQMKSPEGNLAYHKALKSGAQPKEAMKAFWAIINKAERKIKEGRIVGIKSTGLTLSNSRFVDWHIATLKLKNDELLLTVDDLVKLKGILVEHKWGGEFVRAIA